MTAPTSGAATPLSVEHPIFAIHLFGALEVRDDATVISSLESSRAESLLAYLILNREAPRARERLAFLLWPDSNEAQARTNLRHLLHTLRRTMPGFERLIDVNPRTVRWHPTASCWLDVAVFEQAVAQQDWTAAVTVYRGDLLEDCQDEWLLQPRERLREEYLLALGHLARSLEAAGDHVRAIGYAKRLQHQDPVCEETYRLLIRLHHARGDRASALRVFHECAATLGRELGVEPSLETRHAYEAVLALPPEQTIRQEAAGRVASPLVGREAEWEVLTGRWRATEKGATHFVLVTGEAGIGKTRLVEELRVWCAHRGALTAEARSYAAEGSLPYGPLVAWLRSEAFKSRWSRLDQATRTELSTLLRERSRGRTTAADAARVSESDQRQRLFDAIATAIVTRGVPVLLVLDDVQWSDRETLQFLHYLMRLDRQGPLLVVATSRTEDIDTQPAVRVLITGLHAIERLTAIDLRRLTREETAALGERLTREPIRAAATDALYAETEGNPLFVVEQIRAGWTGRDHATGSLSPKVQAAIEARLAQLSESARELAATAAIIGREFTSELLGRVSEADEKTLLRGLDELWRRAIIRERGVDAYDFSHDKIREVAYLALTSARRRYGHLQASRALERLHHDDLGSISAQLAGHYERAAAPDQAVACYMRAAEAAQRVHASHEAVRLLERARDLLAAGDDTVERQRRELAVLTALPASLVAVDGYRSIRLTAIHERALEVTRKLGVAPDAPLLWSLALAALSNFEFDKARQFGGQLRAYSERERDDVLLAQSEYVLGVTAFWQGELDVAKHHFERAIATVRPEHRRTHLVTYGHNPESTCGMRLACTLYFLGETAAATRACDTALAVADEVDHPYSRDLTVVFAALLALEMRDPIRLRAHAAELSGSGRSRHDAVHIRAGADAFAGYVDVLDGHVEPGVARIQRVLSDPAVSERAPGQDALALRVLLEACRVSRQARAGLAAADRALKSSRGVALWTAETHRLRAEFLAALGATQTEVQTEIQQALHVARAQRASLFESRALAALSHS